MHFIDVTGGRLGIYWAYVNDKKLSTSAIPLYDKNFNIFPN